MLNQCTCIVWLNIAYQMFACLGCRNYRCMRMNISSRDINAAAVPFVQQVLVKFR